jgi:sec-independent protein translocase protein TatC
VVSFFVAIPYLLYQAWAFIAPGLYQHERRLILPLVASSAVLFYAGMAFAYYVVFPLVFGFFTSTAPAGVTVATDIASYLDFVLTLFFAFGVAFEIPGGHHTALLDRGDHPKSLRRSAPTSSSGSSWSACC